MLPPDIATEIPVDDLFGRITGLPAETTQVPWDGPKVRIIEHLGHAAGSAALFIEERGVLIAGDMLSDILIPFLELDSADPIKDYLAALLLFEDMADDVKVFIPGHGSVGDADELRARIKLDRAYVQALHDGGVSDDSRLTTEPNKSVHGWQSKQIAPKGG
jgi:glyoxylase-like metal-dependent hydrolase (beta-lactamase superfamily II)